MTRVLDVLEAAGLISRGVRLNDRGKQRGPLYTLNLHIRVLPDRSGLTSEGGDTQVVPVSCPEVRDAQGVPRLGTSMMSPGIPKKENIPSVREVSEPLPGHAGAMVWIDEGTEPFAAWVRRWDLERGFPIKPWTSQHPKTLRDGRWVPTEWPPADDACDVDV